MAKKVELTKAEAVKAAEAAGAFIPSDLQVRTIVGIAKKTIDSLIGKGGIVDLEDALAEKKQKLSEHIMGLMRLAYAASDKASVRQAAFKSLCSVYEAELQRLDAELSGGEKRPVNKIYSSWPVFKSQMSAALQADIAPVVNKVEPESGRTVQEQRSLYDVKTELAAKRAPKAPTVKPGTVTWTPAATAAMKALSDALSGQLAIGQDAIAQKIVELLASLRTNTVAEAAPERAAG